MAGVTAERGVKMSGRERQQQYGRAKQHPERAVGVIAHRGRHRATAPTGYHGFVHEPLGDTRLPRLRVLPE